MSWRFLCACSVVAASAVYIQRRLPIMDGEEKDVKFPKPIFKNGRFKIPWGVDRPSFASVFWGFYKETSQSGILSEDRLNDIEEMKILPINHEAIENPPTNKIQVTWLGHASFLVQFESLNILFDPVFSDRIGPVQSYGMGMKRYRKCPCSVDELPTDLNIVCISHDHYDHLDLKTVRDLDTKYGSKILWCVPLGMKDWFLSTINSKDNVIELNWWDEKRLNNKESEMTIACVPAQHWGKRSINDDNTRLWAGWIVKGNNFSVYHAGDTGYCDVFKSIGERYGPIDLALIPIGAYVPRSVLSFQHVDPVEAVQIHEDIRAKRSLGMHWGTFILTKEPFLEPPKLLQTTLESRGLNMEEFITLKHGETRTFGSEDSQQNFPVLAGEFSNL